MGELAGLLDCIELAEVRDGRPWLAPSLLGAAELASRLLLGALRAGGPASCGLDRLQVQR